MFYDLDYVASYAAHIVHAVRTVHAVHLDCPPHVQPYAICHMPFLVSCLDRKGRARKWRPLQTMHASCAVSRAHLMSEGLNAVLHRSKTHYISLSLLAQRRKSFSIFITVFFLNFFQISLSFFVVD